MEVCSSSDVLSTYHKIMMLLQACPQEDWRIDKGKGVHEYHLIHCTWDRDMHFGGRDNFKEQVIKPDNKRLKDLLSRLEQAYGDVLLKRDQEDRKAKLLQQLYTQ